MSTRDLRDVLCFEDAATASANSAADALPFRGSVMAPPSVGSSRGFHTGEPGEKNLRQFFVDGTCFLYYVIMNDLNTWCCWEKKKMLSDKCFFDVLHRNGALSRLIL